MNAVINRLRETLGDSAEEQQFIVTLPRLGYRFIAPVSGRPSALDKEHARLDDVHTAATTLASQEWGGLATREHSTAPHSQQPERASRGLWSILRSVGGSFRGWLRRVLVE